MRKSLLKYVGPLWRTCCIAAPLLAFFLAEQEPSVTRHSSLKAFILHVDGVAVCEPPVGFNRVKVLISISSAFMVGVLLAYQRKKQPPLSDVFLLPFYTLIDIRLACDRIGCKVNAYSVEVIHYKSFPLWRVKSFIHSLMRLVIQGARPDW